MKKRVISTMLMFAMMITCMTGAFSVSAATAPTDNEIMPLYDYTAVAQSSLSIASGLANCRAKITGYSNVTKIVVTMKLQKKSALWWSTKETWTETYNTNTASFTKLYGGLGSGTYRVQNKYVVYSGSNSETITVNSNEVTI